MSKPLKIISSWEFKGKYFWIVKIAKNDFSVYDGTGVLDISFPSLESAEFSMKKQGAVRIITT